MLFFFFLMIRRPPRSTRTDNSFPTRRSSDLNSKTTFGEQKTVLGLKNFEMKNNSTENGSSASGRADYKVGELSLNDKAIGSAQMEVSLQNLDIPAPMSHMQVYKTKLQHYEQQTAEAATTGEPAPEWEPTKDAED